MNCFPQLVTGAVAQYPLSRSNQRRTVTTTFLDGSRLKLADDAASAVEWNLRFDGMSADEWHTLESFFLSAQGQLKTFVFIDPLSNMLMWSSDLTQTVWARDPGLTITANELDPLGGSLAFRIVNTVQVPQRLTQAVGAPGSFQYCSSLYGRSTSPEAIRLVQSSGSQVQTMSFGLGSQWQRYSMPARLTATEETVTFGLELDPGATVSVFGPQAEAQPQSGAYRATFGQGGVYPNTRFASDSLDLVCPDPEQYSCALRLRSTGV